MSSDTKSVPTELKNTTTTSGLFTYNRFMLKAKYSFYSALVFFIFANPETILILQRFFGGFVDFITPRGAPTMIGIFVTTMLFFTTMLGLMLLPSE
jgi:hypothetical protein